MPAINVLKQIVHIHCTHKLQSSAKRNPRQKPDCAVSKKERSL